MKKRLDWRDIIIWILGIMAITTIIVWIIRGIK